MDNKYVIDTKENREFLKELALELLEFGKMAPAPSGGSYYLGDYGQPMKDRDIETWISCRMAHVYSIGYMMGVPSNAKAIVEKMLEGLMGVLKDKENGGWFYSVASNGKPKAEKLCYAHAFVILAATSASLIRVEKADELLEEALQIFDKYFWDGKDGLSCDTYSSDFKIKDCYRGINANMHTVEAFLAVADVTGNEVYRDRAKRIIDHVIDWASNNNWRIPEHYTEDWNVDLEKNSDKKDDPFKPYGATPGHGIEWSRLIIQWVLSTYGLEAQQCKEYIIKAENLYNRAVKDSWEVDGKPGIVYTTDWKGVPVVRDRMHWTLAEAINSSSVLYRVTGKEEYKNDYYKFMEYLDTVVHDKVNGSWFHQLDENNNLKETVWPGKSDIYHALQAMLIPYSRNDISIAKAIYEEKQNSRRLYGYKMGL